MLAFEPEPKATINGMVELAGDGEAHASVVNGILDQIRRDHAIPSWTLLALALCARRGPRAHPRRGQECPRFASASGRA